MTRRVCVVITARPSYARIKTALAAIRDHPELELQLVVGASAILERYGMTVEVIEQDGFEVAERVYMVLEGGNLVTSAKSTGIGIVELATVFDNLRPDVVVTVADRFETLATAVAASYMNIPLAHAQGGEITKSIDDKVRHAVTKLADLHFVANEAAARRVISMGELRERVFVTGCPSIDLAAELLENDGEALDPFQRYVGVGSTFDFSDGYIVVAQHPVTTEYEQCRQHVMETLHAVHELDVPTFWFWPNVDAGSDGTSKGIRTFRELVDPPRIHFFRSMTPEDFLRLVNHATCVVGNSSVGIRECSFLGIPAVNIGPRQEGRARGSNVIDVGYDQTEVAEAITKQMAQGRFQSESTYGDGQAGRRIAELLATRPLEIET